MFGVPPPLVRKDLIAQMRGEAETLLPPQYLDCLRHIDQPFFKAFCLARRTRSSVCLRRRSHSKHPLCAVLMGRMQVDPVS
jgi:hypothetical protein